MALFIFMNTTLSEVIKTLTEQNNHSPKHYQMALDAWTKKVTELDSGMGGFYKLSEEGEVIMDFFLEFDTADSNTTDTINI